MINPVSFESRIEEQIRELLGIEEDVPDEEIKKEPDNGQEEMEDKFEDLSDEEKLVSDVSDDEDDDLFEGRLIEGHSVGQNSGHNSGHNEGHNAGQSVAIKSERDLDCFSRELDSFLNDKRNPDQVEPPEPESEPEPVAMKTEKYESSISSTEEFDDCMD